MLSFTAHVKVIFRAWNGQRTNTLPNPEIVPNQLSKELEAVRVFRSRPCLAFVFAP